MNDIGNKVVYQIYVKSFMDANGDGLGDIQGITKRLDYLKELGVDYLWLTPVFVSPMRDNGYDVADYYNVDPSFGTMEDLEELIREADQRGIGLMFDMVFNHTSTEHAWFQKALAGEQKYQDYYIFKKGRNGGPPTNWVSKFGGNAWAYVPSMDKYYLHLFDKTQADLNWDNPEVREELYDVVNFWLEKGVKGFRFDVVNLISKPERYEDDFSGDGRRFYTDGPHIHEYIKGLNRNSFGKHEDAITVGEMSSTSIDNCVRYSNPKEEELSMIFNFHHLKVDYHQGEKWSLKPFDFLELKTIFDDWQTGMQEHDGWMALFYNNHDQPRVVSRFGDDGTHHGKAATMLATSIHLLRGTPYIYQGEEIGMTNAYFKHIAEYRDVESTNYHRILLEEGMEESKIMEILSAKSRDNGRTPMRWTPETNFGFTTGTPWIPFGHGPRVNAEEDRGREDSIFAYYQKLIALRKSEPVIAKGSYRMLDKEHDALFIYLREHEGQKMLVINNFYGQEVPYALPQEFLKGYRVLIANYGTEKRDGPSLLLRPYEAVALLVE